jgi:hypothetical protein
MQKKIFDYKGCKMKFIFLALLLSVSSSYANYEPTAEDTFQMEEDSMPITEGFRPQQQQELSQLEEMSPDEMDNSVDDEVIQ